MFSLLLYHKGRATAILGKTGVAKKRFFAPIFALFEKKTFPRLETGKRFPRFWRGNVLFDSPRFTPKMLCIFGDPEKFESASLLGWQNRPADAGGGTVSPQNLRFCGAPLDLIDFREINSRKSFRATGRVPLSRVPGADAPK